jgi:hypothetical protein
MMMGWDEKVSVTDAGHPWVYCCNSWWVNTGYLKRRNEGRFHVCSSLIIVSRAPEVQMFLHCLFYRGLPMTFLMNFTDQFCTVLHKVLAYRCLEYKKYLQTTFAMVSRLSNWKQRALELFFWSAILQSKG